MKNILPLIFCAFLFLGAERSGKLNLTVSISGFPSDAGKAYIGLFRKGDKFPEMSGQFIGKIIPIENKKAEISFSNLSENSYAIAVFHDKNKNGKLDKNMLGIPTENYGFSNNARETFSAPSFESAAVKLDQSKSISIHIK